MLSLSLDFKTEFGSGKIDFDNNFQADEKKQQVPFSPSTYPKLACRVYASKYA